MIILTLNHENPCNACFINTMNFMRLFLVLIKTSFVTRRSSNVYIESPFIHWNTYIFVLSVIGPNFLHLLTAWDKMLIYHDLRRIVIYVLWGKLVIKRRTQKILNMYIKCP